MNKILFLVPKMNRSGVPKIISWLSAKLVQDGNQVSILAFFSKQCEQELNEGVVFKSLNISQSSNFLVRNTLQMATIIKKINTEIESYKPNLVITFLDSVGFLFILYTKLRLRKVGFKILCSERSDPYYYKKGQSFIRSTCISFSDCIVFQTNEASNYYCKKIRNKSVVIPNPVIVNDDITDRYIRLTVPFCQRKDVVVSVGRFTMRQKRQDILLKAFQNVCQSYPDIRLIIYGDGRDRSLIEGMIEELGISDKVVLAGIVNNIEEKIFDAKMFVLSSDYEGIPNSLIEAMVIGVPCVSTDCSPGGARLLIENGENGYLVERENYIQMAEKMKNLIENENISNQFSINSRKIADKFSEDKIFAMWKQLIQKLCK